MLDNLPNSVSKVPLVNKLDLRQNVYVRNLFGGLELVMSNTVTKWSAFFLGFVFFLGIFGPPLAPHHYSEQFFRPDGTLKLALPPLSEGHLLGTTNQGQDILSRLLYGARPTILIGLGGGIMVSVIGTTVGVIAGYVGGRTEFALMRIVDMIYAIPLIPFAILMVVFFNIGLGTTILIIGVILWRGSARVLRSQVLQIKERPYIEAARATGASDRYIILKHVLPNIVNMIALFLALGIGISILVQANLAFIGVSDPFTPTWGVMIRNAYTSGRFAEMWWWSLTPGFLISTTVLCTFLLGRGYESLRNQRSGRQNVDSTEVIA